MGILKWWPVAVLLAGCAQVSAPTGGPMDEDPPQVVAVDPPAGTTNWEGGVLRIAFDEYVQVKNFREQWLISPPLDALPTYRLRGKTLELDWSDVTLPEGTTVVLDLGESVVDLHEGNPFLKGVWAASTGPDLDSLRWSGQILHRDFATPTPGIRVMLFPAAWPLDSLLAGARPRYVGLTDAAGRFDVGYIAPGRYRTWAVEDVNKDWAWQPGESVGWGPVWEAGDTLPTAMTLFPTAEPESVYPGRATADSSGVIAVEWHGPAATRHVSWRGLDGDSLNWWADRDSVWIWPSDPDTLVWTWQGGADTLAVRRSAARRPQQPSAKPSGKHVASRLRTIRYAQPISAIDPAGWRIIVDSIEVGFDSLTLLTPFEIALHAAEAPGVKYTLEVDPGGVTLLGGQPTDSVETHWATWPADHLSELIVTAKAPAVAGRLRLEDAAGRNLAERPLAADDSIQWVIRELLPGKVELVWESDRHSEGAFQEADPALNRLGDVRLKAAGGLELRSNWTVEWQWSIDTGKFPKLQ